MNYDFVLFSYIKMNNKCNNCLNILLIVISFIIILVVPISSTGLLYFKYRQCPNGYLK